MLGTCPVPKSDYDRILLGHGSGGQLTSELIRRLFVPALRQRHSGGAGRSGHLDVLEKPDGHWRRKARASLSPPIPSSSGRSFSPAAISAGSRSMARSMIWPSAEPRLCCFRRRSFSKKDCRSPICSASSPRCAQPARSRRRTGHGRHQGRRSRQRGPDLHHHLRHRHRARRRCPVDSQCPARRLHSGFGDDRRSRHRHHVGARRDRI